MAQRRRRLTYVLDAADDHGDDRHCAGVNALVASSGAGGGGGGSSWLWTAGRDSSVRRWDLRGAKPRAAGALQGHTDWVNAMALLERSQSLVTASSDRTVRCWRADGSGACVGVAREHNDYVMSVGAAASANRFVSAGLKGEVFTWDLATMVATERMPEPEPAAALFHAVSVYAAAMDGAGNIAVTGSTDNVVRVWDARVGGAAKPLKLLGHEDNVRCVAVNAEGTMALSGGSDATIRLWDLRQHRCSQTLAVHSDSVWALAADPRWTSVLSAGRDKRCYRTDLRSRESSPAFESETPIAAMAVEANQASVWVSGPSSSVHKWFLEGGGGRRARSNAFVAGTSPIAHKRMVETAEAKGEVLATPEQLSPAATIEGLPGIVQHQVLADKRHVLTRDSAGQVALWDVVAGEQTRSYDKADFDETFKSIETKDVVTSWFAIDARLGRLAIHLECPQCFRAECYSVDLGLGGEDDVRVCPGDIVLRSLLSRWVDKQRRASGSRRSSKDPAKAKGEAVKPLVDTLAPAASVVTADASGVTWRKAATDLTGAEGVDMFPEWVIDCVLRDTYPVPAGLKCSFRLLPAEGSNLAPIPNPKLTAPRILRIRKVLKYIAGKQDMNAKEQARPAHELLEVMCKGQVLPLDYSLAAIRAHVWKRPEDLVLTFRRRKA